MQRDPSIRLPSSSVSSIFLFLPLLIWKEGEILRRKLLYAQYNEESIRKLYLE